MRWGDLEFDDEDWDEDDFQKPGSCNLTSRRQGEVQKARSAMVVHNRQPLCVAGSDGEGAPMYASFKRFVTFYITNFPPLASTFFLRKVFEVCEILENVFIANKRNVNDEVYGFVRYAKVRDMDKLLKALNNVSFGQYNVCAKLARFDKKAPKEVEEEKVRKGERGKAVGRSDGEGAYGVYNVRKKEVVVIIAKATVKGKKETVTNIIAPKKLVRCYRPCEMDTNWATRGLVVTVRNGESIPIVQKRVEDAGFKEIDIIPLGVDKVFVQSLSAVSASEIVRETKQFFDIIFASLV